MTRTLRIGLFVLAAGCVLLGGCRRHVQTTELGLRTGRVSERRLTNLLRVASEDMGCPAAMLQRQELAHGVYEVAGCNLVRHYSMPCSNRYRCRWSQIVPIESMVPSHFQCQPPQVYIQPTNDPVRRIVTACDRQAQYVLSCNELDCAWFVEGAIVAAAPVVAAMPASAAAPQAADTPAHAAAPQPAPQ